MMKAWSLVLLLGVALAQPLAPEKGDDAETESALETFDADEGETQDALSSKFSCYPTDNNYIGLVSNTKTGKTCQNWLETFPNKIPADKSPSAKDDVTKDHNYCRQLESGKAPQCFPVSGGSPEDCAVDPCPKDDTVDNMKSVRDEMVDALGAEPSAKDCECADALFGSTSTTDDTSVAGTGRSLLQQRARVGVMVNGKCVCDQ